MCVCILLESNLSFFLFSFYEFNYCLIDEIEIERERNRERESYLYMRFRSNLLFSYVIIILIINESAILRY